MNNKTLIIHNPKSGPRSSEEIIRRLINQLEEKNTTIQTTQTKHAGHATEFCKNINLSEFNKLIICGGDGTFNEVINGSQIIAMHKNRYWRSSRGLSIDLGAFVAALEYASGKSAAIMGKPDPNMFRLAIQSWDVLPGSIFVIGDDIEVDVCGAKNIGMQSVLVKTGKFREDVLAHSTIVPDHIIESVADLPGLLKLS